MNARLINQAADLICRTMKNRREPASLAMALDNAGMLQSPETAAKAERDRESLRALRADALNMRGTLAPTGQPRRVPMPLGESLTPVVEWLLDEADRLRTQVAAVAALLPTEPCQDRGLPNEIANAQGEYGAFGLVADALGITLPYAPETPLCGHISPYGRTCDYAKDHTGDHGMSDGHGGHFGWSIEEPKHPAPCRWPSSPGCVCARPSVLAAPPEPNGCGICGIPSERPHGLQSTPGGGLHQWTAPTDEQIKARIQERRAIALAARGERP